MLIQGAGDKCSDFAERGVGAKLNYLELSGNLFSLAALAQLSHSGGTGRLGTVVGNWCYLGDPMERAFLIVARTHSTQPDGAPVELKTLIEYEPHSAAAIRL